MLTDQPTTESDYVPIQDPLVSLIESIEHDIDGARAIYTSLLGPIHSKTLAELEAKIIGQAVDTDISDGQKTALEAYHTLQKNKPQLGFMASSDNMNNLVFSKDNSILCLERQIAVQPVIINPRSIGINDEQTMLEVYTQHVLFAIQQVPMLFAIAALSEQSERRTTIPPEERNTDDDTAKASIILNETRYFLQNNYELMCTAATHSVMEQLGHADNQLRTPDHLDAIQLSRFKVLGPGIFHFAPNWHDIGIIQMMDEPIQECVKGFKNIPVYKCRMK